MAWIRKPEYPERETFVEARQLLHIRVGGFVCFQGFNSLGMVFVPIPEKPDVIPEILPRRLLAINSLEKWPRLVILPDTEVRDAQLILSLEIGRSHRVQCFQRSDGLLWFLASKTDQPQIVESARVPWIKLQRTVKKIERLPVILLVICQHSLGYEHIGIATLRVSHRGRDKTYQGETDEEEEE